MREDSPRWEEGNPSEFPHEQDGLRALREYLPDANPFHVWPNVEFVGPDGSINEIDALVLTPGGLHIVELKHWQGEISGSGTQWVRRYPKGRLAPVDNPLLLANRKAKRLRSLLRYYANQGNHGRAPYVGAVIFLHAQNMQQNLDTFGRMHVYGLDGGNAGLPSLKGFLLASPTDPRQAVDTRRGRQIVELVRKGVRTSVSKRRIGQLILHSKPFAEGPGWQDFLAGHAIDTDLVRRVRFYLTEEGDDEQPARAAAEREFRLLQGVHHPGIAHPVDLVERERGLAVAFDHAAGSIRLDEWLIQQEARLTLAQRLQLVQDLAEIVDYAHSRRLTHRALHPRAIFVTEQKRGKPSLLVTDWQASRRLPSTGHRSPNGPSSDGTDLELFFDDEMRCYHAPEAAVDTKAPGVPLDVFALGAVAYRILTGVAPAETGEQLLAAVRNQGLDIAAAVDGMPNNLVDLIYSATHGDPKHRTPSMMAFRKGLDAVWEELTAPEPEPVTDPLEANKGDVLEGGLTVVRRLGAGATAVALLVTHEGRELVLKVARDDRHDERLTAEAEVLDNLRKHWQVASLVKGPLIVGGRTALLLESAGATTLLEELQGGRLALGMLERYGRDLLEIVAFLDGEGVWHRDLKPANLAMRPRPKDSRLHLCAFDFSLASTPADQLNAGTPPYTDPFLGPPQRTRYDAAAERFAASVTLYEMATGILPRWGENANPVATDDEVNLDSALFDTAIADRMMTFFSRALARDAAKRFDTIDEMVDAWRGMFRDLPQPVPDSPAITPESSLDVTSLTPRARSALERLGVHTVAELLAYDGSELRRAKGIPDATRKEISAYIRDVRPQFETPPAEPPVEERPAYGIEAICAKLLPEPKQTSKSATAKSTIELDTMRVMLGQSPSDAGGYLRWPSQPEGARVTGQSQPQISTWLRKHAKKWRSLPALNPVRDEIVALLDTRGAVMSAEELAEALAAARGTYTSGPQRLAQAIGLVRAAVEAELERGGNARVAIYRFRTSDTVLIGRESDNPAATTTARDLLDYAVALGQRAAKLADADPLLSKQRAIDELRTTTQPEGMPVLSDNRLLQLAAAASNGVAAVSAQWQLYPVGMPAERALRLAAGALVGRRMTEETVRSRVQSRFPAAKPLPGRPTLDGLLEGYGLSWDRTTKTYAPPPLRHSATSTRMMPTAGPLPTPTEVDAVSAKLAAAIEHRRFMAVLTQPKLLEKARPALLHHFRLTEINVTAIMIDLLRSLGHPWEVIVAADTGSAHDPDFRALTDLIRHRVVPAVAESLERPDPVLITDASPLARYGQLRVIQELADPTRTRPAARLLLVAARRAEPAMLDGVQLPLTSPASQSLWLPEPWISTAEGGASAR
ncbi:BREX system serine/threonine kinase PglW [Nocardia sp. SC052]|uniref:BREX system serine/threonine kinase PglW n=1 Tax=Nocardia sichangensis TaxID=3385975 RepID=UPI0039A281AC